MFLGFPDPDPLVRGMDPDPDPIYTVDPDPHDCRLDPKNVKKCIVVIGCMFSFDGYRLLL